MILFRGLEKRFQPAMELNMFLIHPILQGIAILLSLYAAYLGSQRFLSLHMKRKRRFLWKRHVTIGSLVFFIWLAGIVGGISIVRIFWRGFLVTGNHGKIGLFLVPFILFGLLTGYYMNRRKRKRIVLPLIHGINNALVILIALIQIDTGLDAYRAFVLGG